jgi:hypothetical protein
MIDSYRRMSPARKWQNLLDDYSFARMLHAAGLSQRQPGISLPEIQEDWIRATLGYALPVKVRGPILEPHMQSPQPSLRMVVDVLERMGIPYAVGGSIASSFHGVGRLTRDADLTVEPFPGREDEFVAQFDANEFYISVVAVRHAIGGRSCFNILHPATGFTIDLFVRKDEPFELAAFARREEVSLPDVPDRPVTIHSPEDTILFELRWYRLGGQTSEKQ